jgi:hypothetical protein
MNKSYWTIEYKITFLSDFHVGSGITLMGGNQHGLRLDIDGFPYMPATQVKGLLRLGGIKLKSWQPQLKDLFESNFGEINKRYGNFWSFSPARYPSDTISTNIVDAMSLGLLNEQSHIYIKDGIAENLFSCQKAGRLDDFSYWQGKIFSSEPAEEKDAAFLIACMRAEDRMGHRRTRGYGKIDWSISSVSSYVAGEKPVSLDKSLSDWLNIILK